MSRAAKQRRAAFRRRVRDELGLDRGGERLVDQAVGAFLGVLTRGELREIFAGELPWLDATERLRLERAALDEPPPTLEEVDREVRVEVDAARLEALDEAIARALRAWNPNHQKGGNEA